MNIKSIVLLVTISLFAVNAMAASKAISEQQILQAQQEWGQGIVIIGKAKLDGKDYKSAAKAHIEKLYDYSNGRVLFKPTKAKNDQFRQTFGEALSYFVTGEVSEDDGFAINPWTKVRFDNHDISIHGDVAFAMGNYYFTTTDNKEVKVEYTFGYRLDEAGQLRIVLHHSSLPFSA